jgi:sulfatase maturation enzyme AslB (radical SAM superfamily)
MNEKAKKLISEYNLKNYVCKRPFENLDIQEDSQWLCCPSWAPVNIRGHREPLKIDEDLVGNWKSQLAQDLRRTVLDGSYSMCDHELCPSLSMVKNSETPYTSNFIPGPGVNFLKRSHFKDRFGIGTADEIAKFDKLPARLTLSFDSSCNLKCPSCRNSIIPNDDVDSEQYKIKKYMMDMIDDEFGESAKSIMITASGDPVYSKLYREYLINFDASKYPNLDFIHLLTNGVLLDEKMWNSFKAKPYIKTLDISVDAGNKETYENIVRLNGDWDKLMDNIRFLCKQDVIDTLMFSMVVCKYNYKEMLQMYEVIMDILKDVTGKTIKFVYTQLLPNSHGAYTFDEYNNITIFKETNPEFESFKTELMKIHGKPHVNHNFHHLIK